MLRHIAGSVLALTLLAAPVAFAHEGHARKVMGTVTLAAADHVMLRTTDGKDHRITMNGATKVIRGTMAMKVADLKPGTRVVINATGDKEPYLARAIQVGTAAKPAPAKDKR